jgi:thioredoxin 1
MSKIYYFSADWCGPCKQLGPTMEKSGLPFQKINVDSDTALSSQFGIRNIPTLVKVDERGEEVGRITGNKSLIEIQNWYNG